MMHCPMTVEEWTDFCEGKSRPGRTDQLQKHLDSGCVICNAQVAFLRGVLTDLRVAASLETPIFSLAATREMFSERWAQRSVTRRSLKATLLFDGFQMPAFVGMRGVASSYSRLYQAGEYAVDLWHEPMGDGLWYLIGQATETQAKVFPDILEAIAESNSGARYPALIDRGGSQTEFHFEGLAVGQYAVRLSLPDAEILLPEVSAGG